MAHLCIYGEMLVLIMKQLMCCKYSYVVSTINCLTLDTVVTLFLFIWHSVPISYSSTAAYLFLFIYRIVWDSISESLQDYQLRTEQLIAFDRVLEFSGPAAGFSKLRTNCVAVS